MPMQRTSPKHANTYLRIAPYWRTNVISRALHRKSSLQQIYSERRRESSHPRIPYKLGSLQKMEPYQTTPPCGDIWHQSKSAHLLICSRYLRLCSFYSLRFYPELRRQYLRHRPMLPVSMQENILLFAIRSNYCKRPQSSIAQVNPPSPPPTQRRYVHIPASTAIRSHRSPRTSNLRC